METVWFNVNYYESLGDIYTKYSFLNLQNNQVTNLIDAECIKFLQSKIFSTDELNYFSYDLKYDKSGDMITIIADNIVCALWFIGIFPLNTSQVLHENRFENKEFIYTFDKKTCKLKRRVQKGNKYLHI